MQPQDILKAMMDEIQELARTKTVVGDALTIGDTTVIPVIRLSVGFGAGGGEGGGKDTKSGGEGTGSGGGGGGGVKIEPAAFIVSRAGEFSIMAAPGKRSGFSELFENLPDVVSKVMAAQKTAKNEEGDDTDADAT